ncbi:stalk domain-containing protein [Paenibacillus soyae]|uniref:Stalk domain-containing protein n=1 Tax=Paenibacillus soyae TaxID=2969249 RepID=A0A9X2MTB9_9BACL|nr:stalk domain-containing protein [Paenibacillus soyae]MCR2803352.1 stalk domain-containing protein [Paenibacillus soyae]
MHRYLVCSLSALLLLILVIPAAYTAAKTPRVDIYFEDSLLTFEDAAPIVKNGRTLVPFRKLFETFGFTVNWVDKDGVRKATGTKTGLSIELPINGKFASVNGRQVELDVPAQLVNGRTMIPLRFVAENSGYEVSFANQGDVYVIRISGASSHAEAEPYVVKGRVVDEEGHPVKGAEVFADNQLLYNSNLHAVTDEDGFYRIELPLLATTWNMGGSHTVVIDGSSFEVDLIPDIDQPFAGNTGAVRNFTMDVNTATGYLYLYMDINSFVNGYYENDVKITLTRLGAGGREGDPVSGYGYNFPGGFGIDQVPVGQYRATAVFAPPGEEPLPLLIRERNRNQQYAESVEFDFSPLTPGIYEAHIEVMVP